MAVKAVFVDDGHIGCISDIPLGQHFTLSHWARMDNVADYEVWQRVDGCRAVAQDYRKTARVLKPHEVGIINVNSHRLRAISGLSGAYLVEYKEVADEQSRTPKKRTKRH